MKMFKSPFFSHHVRFKTNRIHAVILSLSKDHLKIAKSCKDAMKLMSPQCVLHKFLLLQDVAARCPCNLTPGPRLHNADVVLENVTLTFDSKNTPIMFLKNGSRYGL